MSYRSLTKIVEAYQWQWDIASMLEFMENKNLYLDLSYNGSRDILLSIKTRTGMRLVPLSYWIIKYADGTYDVMNDEQFKLAYEEITEEDPEETGGDTDAPTTEP